MKIKLLFNENSKLAESVVEPACVHLNGTVYLYNGSSSGNYCSEHNTSWQVNKDRYQVVENKMNIKEKFVLALTKEPKKSFRKAGITDGDDLLTDEGTKVFLTWLLHNKYSEEFKKEVVEEMLEKEEK